MNIHNSASYYVDKLLHEFFNTSLATATIEQVEKVCIVIKILKTEDE